MDEATARLPWLDDCPEILGRLAQLQHAERALGEVRRELDAARKLKAVAQEDALERLRIWWEDPKLPTFLWQFDFAEIFHRRAAEGNRGGWRAGERLFG